MPTYKITHAIEATITHVVEADSPDLANREVVERGVARSRELEHQHRDLSFGAVDDSYEAPAEVPSSTPAAL